MRRFPLPVHAVLLGLFLPAGGACSTPPPADDGSWGSYVGTPHLIEGIPNEPRKRTLRREIVYTDPGGSKWTAPAGSIIDGASIPQFLWSLVGGPFEGLYVDASIIHDVYCVTRTRTSDQTHDMFYVAMRCSGVGRFRATYMWAAVKAFGPQWAVPNPAVAPAAAQDILGQPDPEIKERLTNLWKYALASDEASVAHVKALSPDLEREFEVHQKRIEKEFKELVTAEFKSIRKLVEERAQKK